jgi:hypothetical protein
LATRELLTPSQRQQFYEVPENMGQRELARYYTITPEEKSVIHQQRGAPNRLGYAVQICYLRFPIGTYERRLIPKSQAELVDFHHTHPFSIYFGDGTTSSSDGQDFRAGHQARSSAQVNTHYGSDPRIKLYSHLSD